MYKKTNILKRATRKLLSNRAEVKISLIIQMYREHVRPCRDDRRYF